MRCYDAKFYELRALWFYARERRREVAANVRLPRLDVPYSRRPEIDGILDEDRYQRAIEVKSYRLSDDDVGGICDHYKELGFRCLTIIAPGFDGKPPSGGTLDVELVSFSPDVAALRSYYAGPWTSRSTRVGEWLAEGGIHFRYSLAEVSPTSARLRRTVNQVDKGIRSVEHLSRELARRVVPTFTPIRVHWSPYRLLCPKDLYFHGRRNYPLETPLAYDIDGSAIHGAMFPCMIDPETGLCADCITLAKQHALRLVAYLRKIDLEPTVFFSGHQGFHVYVFRPGAMAQRRHALTRELIGQRIGIDRQIARVQIPILGFPTSVHGTTMRVMTEVTDLPSFRPEHSELVGVP